RCGDHGGRGIAGADCVEGRAGRLSPPASANRDGSGGSPIDATVAGRGRGDALMKYKGYIGKVEFDDEAGIFHGEVVNTRDVITFQGESVPELKKAFRDSVDDYLAFCAERGEQPDKPFSGQFLTRIPPELHREVNLAAKMSGK